MPSNLLIIFAKQPIAGRVKTRLGQDIGTVAATWWFRHQSARLMRRLSLNPRWQVMLAVSPDTAVTSAIWPAQFPRLAQGSGDLGERMAKALTRFRRPSIVVGTDIPGITPAHIERAFAALGSHDAVFGPAEDGGYWLIGLSGRRPAPQDFLRSVRWSSAHALSDSIATLPADWRITQIDTLRDVDTAADLAQLS